MGIIIPMIPKAGKHPKRMTIQGHKARVKQQAARGKKKIYFLVSDQGYWERAGFLRSHLLAKGEKARLADTLIAQSCLAHGIPLITRDQDFKRFAHASELKLLIHT
ncbi:MAG: PIN domain-containing protein [Chlamydiae bacterium]|nr:PIN domain-containing protein [Chlamydiota bacterium]MBI3265504.1 PIN domain-containing protein [Chlamydiota bacterium]